MQQDPPPEPSSATADKGLQVAMIVLARYLNGADAGFADYIARSYRQAEQAGLAQEDLDMLRTLAGAIGRRL